MKTCVRTILALLIVLSTGMQPAYAVRGGHHGHGGGQVGFGVFLGPGWWGPYPYPFPYYPSYPYAPYYSPPAVIIQQPPEISVQPAPQAEAPSYWYYCKDPQGYYPTVTRCPKGWMRVVPPTNPLEGEE